MPQDAGDEKNSPQEPILNEDFSNVVVVDNIPKITIARFEKLCAVIRKIYSKHGKIVQDGIFLPVEEKNGKQMTCGHAFIEYETAEMAKNAIAKGDMKNLDNKHQMRVNLFSDFKKFAEMKEEYEPPAQTDFETKTNFSSWLLDDTMRDQFVVRYANETEIYWNDPIRASQSDGRVLVYDGGREKEKGRQWTEMYVAWSTQGSFLATFHGQGIVVWGGEDFDRMGRFVHPGVKAIDFSPTEKYLVTGNMTAKVNEKDPDPIIVWDVRSFKKKRGFPKGKRFVWSHDDRFFARIGPDVISVYETPHMGLLDKKSIKCPGVKEIAWAPDRNFISFWVPERGSGSNIPAKVALIELPSKKVVREKHLYNVVEIKLFWQSQGDFLAVQVVSRKTKKTLKTHFEIFRMKEKDVPIEVLEIEDTVHGFAWEKSGPKFGVIHGDGNRPNVSFYQCKKKIKLLDTIENQPANCLFWAPNGATCVLGGLGALNGALGFVDVATMKLVVETEHFMATEIEWDPSGRYMITSVTQPLEPNGNFRYTMENGYKVWSAQGVLLSQMKLDQSYQIMWRPRPKSLLSKQQKKDVAKNLKKYWKEFEKADAEVKQSQLSGAAKQKKEYKDAWKAYRAEREAEYLAEAPLRQELRGGLLSDDENDYEEVEEIEEVFLDEKTEVLE